MKCHELKNVRVYKNWLQLPVGARFRFVIPQGYNPDDYPVGERYLKETCIRVLDYDGDAFVNIDHNGFLFSRYVDNDRPVYEVTAMGHPVPLESE